MAHSPEPWELIPDEDYDAWELIPDEDCDENQMSILDASGARIARVYGTRGDVFGHTDPATLVANANLLLAAPNLRAACQRLSSQLSYLQELWGKEAITEGLVKELQAALAKAAGKEGATP